MIKVTIPGKGELELKYVVFDVNGTLAVDGQLLPGVPELLDNLKDHLEIHLRVLARAGRRETAMNASDEVPALSQLIAETDPGQNDVCLIEQKPRPTSCPQRIRLAVVELLEVDPLDPNARGHRQGPGAHRIADKQGDRLGARDPVRLTARSTEPQQFHPAADHVPEIFLLKAILFVAMEAKTDLDLVLDP